MVPPVCNKECLIGNAQTIRDVELSGSGAKTITYFSHKRSIITAEHKHTAMSIGSDIQQSCMHTNGTRRQFTLLTDAANKYTNGAVHENTMMLVVQHKQLLTSKTQIPGRTSLVVIIILHLDLSHELV
jgi:hypothetical protein